MQQQQPDIIRVLAIKAVRRYIDEAMMARSVICPSECASEILGIYPSCPLDEEAVREEVARAAEEAGVPMKEGCRRSLKKPLAQRVRAIGTVSPQYGGLSKGPLKLRSA